MRPNHRATITLALHAVREAALNAWALAVNAWALAVDAREVASQCSMGSTSGRALHVLLAGVRHSIQQLQSCQLVQRTDLEKQSANDSEAGTEGQRSREAEK